MTNRPKYAAQPLKYTSAKGTSFHGYPLFSVDGSELSFPGDGLEPLCWAKVPNAARGRQALHLNAIYHMQSGAFQDVLFQKIKERDENKAFAAMLARGRFPDKAIFVADRGYECYNTLAAIQEQGGFYVGRSRQGKGSMLSGLSLPDKEGMDQKVSVVICKEHTRKTKEEPERYKRVRQGTRFDFFTDGRTEYALELRVVKIRLSDGAEEYLVTNLPEEEFKIEALKEIYHMRWEIETAFLHLKYALSAAAVHSRRYELVIQELYAKIIMFNFCKELIREVHVPQKEGWKHRYKLNITMAFTICMDFWRSPEDTAPEGLGGALLRYLVPVREGRSAPRRAGKKPAIHFNHRIT